MRTVNVSNNMIGNITNGWAWVDRGDYGRDYGLSIENQISNKDI